MTTERLTEVDDREGQNVSLSDIDEGVVPSAEQPGRRRGKRVSLSILALLLLIGVAGAGGYFLLRGERIDLKANKQLPEKASSGSDIRKAAYDSISDSLTAPAPTTSPTDLAVGKPTEIDVSGINQTKPVLPAVTDSERVAAPVQPGIAATLAPPPEALATKTSPAPETKTDRQGPSSLNGSSKPSATSTASLSVRFASVDQQERSIKAGAKQAGESASANNRRTIDQPNNRIGEPKLANRRSDLPSFGAMLPVRLMGALYTLRTGSLARFELTRNLRTDHWRIAKKVEGITLPRPFASLTEIAALNWSVESLRERSFNPHETEQLNEWAKHYAATRR